MPTDTIVIQPNRATATQLVSAGDGPTLIVNSDLHNTVYLGNTDSIKPTDPSGVVPLAPNGSVAVDGTLDYFGVILGSATATTVYTIAGGLSSFLGITQGGGNLAIPSIQSPNFNLSNPSSSPNPSWAILQSGIAYFVGLVLSGGTITGPDYIINSAGIFIYSGVPALGNLVGSWASVAGVDGFGNPYQKDLTVYIGNGGYVNVNSSGGFGGNTAVIINPGFTSHITTEPQILAGSVNSGLVNELEYVLISSGKANSNDDAAIGFNSESADGTIGAVMNIEFGGTVLAQLFKTIWDIGVPISCTLGTITNRTLITTDTWHPITLDAGWTAGTPVPQYRLTIEGNIQFTGNASHANMVGGTNVNSANPLPSAYRPANLHYYRSNDGNRAGLEYQPTGIIEAWPIAAGNTTVNFDGIVSLL